MHRLGVLGLLVVALLGACTQPPSPPASQADGSGGPTPAGGPPMIAGTVTAGPICPVEQNPPDPACAPRPVAGAVIVATNADGDEVGRATSAADGTFEMAVGQTGTLLLTGQPVEGLMGVPEPLAIEISDPGQDVRVDLVYDTGIR